MRLRFGDFVLDFERRQLLRGAQPVEMSPKAFQLLSLLVKKRPRALGKDEILESLWPGTFVSEGNLASLVNEIRHALGEKGRDSGSIRTVHGFGYAFGREAMAEPEEEVRVRAVAPRHRLVWGQRVILLSEGENLMGRSSDLPVWIGHPSVSREHARIVVAGDRAELEDLGSKNGTWVGPARLTGRHLLSNGEQVRVGRVLVTYFNSLGERHEDTQTDSGSASGKVRGWREEGQAAKRPN